MRSLLVLAFILSAACSKGSSSKPSPAAKPAESPTNADGSCRDSWRAQLKEWMGPGSATMTAECKHGKPTLTLDGQDAHDDADSEPLPAQTFALTADEWSSLWKQLEAAHWRDLAATCSGKADPDVGEGLTDVDLDITDGSTTKKVKCTATSLTAQHADIMDAIEKMSDAASERPAKEDTADCVDVKSVTLKQWNYGEKKPSTVLVACQDGQRKMSLLQDGMEPIAYTLTADVWESLWTQLDATSWRDVTTKCPKNGAFSSIYSNENQSVEKLEVQITDGEVTGKFACKTAHLASQHVAITDAMVEAMMAAVKSPST
jgi:hypothetical protein